MNNNITLADICNANNLAKAFKETTRETFWKESVQRYGLNLLQNIRKAQVEITDGSYTSKPMREFIIRDRGKTRRIKAPHIFDRVIQRCLNDYVLFPSMQDKLIYDNGASIKGKGLSFSRKRFMNHLQNAYNEYGEDGVILHGDFTKFFDNLLHKESVEMTKPLVNNDLLKFIESRIREFAVDVSFMSDEEYKHCLEQIHDSVTYNFPKELRTGKKLMYKSMSVGNHIAQLYGVFYPTKFDNFFKIVKSFKYYGRYMDDFYIIYNNKEELLRVLKEVEPICKKLGLHINHKKTYIKPIREWNVFLKINHKIDAYGKIIRKPCNVLWRRERKRLLKYKKLLLGKQLKIQDIHNCFRSWLGTYKKLQCGNRIYKIKQYFQKLFYNELYEYFVKHKFNYKYKFRPFPINIYKFSY